MIYVYDVELGTTPRRLTFEGGNHDPVWSPDGTRVAFGSDRDSEGTAERDLFIKTVADDAPPIRILRTEMDVAPWDWHQDRLLFSSGPETASWNLWTMESSDSSTAAAYLELQGIQSRASVSPEGQHVVYGSGEGGDRRVYVRGYPQPRQPVVISPEGGRFPKWSPDGDRIYYWRVGLQTEDSLFAANVVLEPTFAVTSTEFVLSGDFTVNRGWDLHPDGDRFVIGRGTTASAAPQDAGAGPEPYRHVIATNWFSELLALVGGGS